MAEKSSIEIHLKRSFSNEDESAVGELIAQWRVYDVEVHRSKSSSDIKLFHSPRAKNILLAQLNQLYPGEHLTGM